MFPFEVCLDCSYVFKILSRRYSCWVWCHLLWNERKLLPLVCLCDGLQGRKVTRRAATAWIAASLSTETFSHAELPNSSFIVCAGTPADIFCNLASFQDEGEKKKQRKPRTHLDRASWEDGGEASGAPRPGSVQSHLQKQSHLLAAASPASPPPPLHPLSLPHSLSPTSLHIVLLPISLSVINYKRHKPPGLMPRCGCLPSCTFPRAKRPASLITPGTLSGSPLAGRQRSPNGPFTVPKDTSAFFLSFFCFFFFQQISWGSLLFLVLSRVEVFRF